MCIFSLPLVSRRRKSFPPICTFLGLAPEAEFPSAEATRINRYIWPRRNFLFEPLQVCHRSNSIDCFFDARARPLDSATAVRLYLSKKGHDRGLSKENL
jgi:hypothetical protein